MTTISLDELEDIVASYLKDYAENPPAPAQTYFSGASFSGSFFIFGKNWDKSTVRIQLSDAKEYIAFLKDNQRRLKEIIEG